MKNGRWTRVTTKRPGPRIAGPSSSSNKGAGVTRKVFFRLRPMYRSRGVRAFISGPRRTVGPCESAGRHGFPAKKANGGVFPARGEPIFRIMPGSYDTCIARRFRRAISFLYAVVFGPPGEFAKNEDAAGNRHAVLTTPGNRRVFAMRTHFDRHGPGRFSEPVVLCFPGRPDDAGKSSGPGRTAARQFQSFQPAGTGRSSISRLRAGPAGS